MGNTRAYNVVRVDTSANFPDIKAIESVKYLGASGGSANIRKAVAAADNSGNIVWSASGTSDQMDHDLDIPSSQGVYVTVASGAILLIYLESE